MPTIARDELESGAEIVYRHMVPTAQIHWPLLSERTGAEVWVKHENQTSIGAFKIRGGLVYMTRLKKDQPDCPGVVTATRGNHGQSVALAAAKVGLQATILVPYGNNLEKNAAMRAFGAELIELGDDFQEAHEYAVELGQERGLHIIPPFHTRLVQGVGTYAIEFLSTVHDLDTVYVPIGQGSGICGLISARDALGMRTEVVGVVAENAPCYALSFKSGVPISTDSSDTLADGMACREPIKEAVDIIQTGAERVLTLSEDEILDAINYYYTDTHNAAEGAGAAPLAGLIKERNRMAGKKVGLILSGGNADKALFMRALSRS